MGLHDDIDRVETLFHHIYFIPEGTVVPNGGTPITVAKNVWPDATPTDNYADFKLKELEDVTPETTSESEDRLYVSETTAGYTKEKITTRDSQADVIGTSRTNGLVKMLERGLASMPVPGAAQTPRARKETFVDGVMLKETGVVGLGVITERLHTWARMELVKSGGAPNKTNKVQLKITELDADNNTFEMPEL